MKKFSQLIGRRSVPTSQTCVGRAGHAAAELLEGRVLLAATVFHPQAPVAAGNEPRAIAVADLNTDGKLDMVVANFASGNVSVFGGNGSGGFAPAQNIATGVKPILVAVADVNGDGKPDLLVANYGSNSVSVLRGNGDGSFKPQQTIAAGSGPASIAVGDVNGDGRMDLVLADYLGNAAGVLAGNGDGSFQALKTFAAGTRPISIGTGDLNNDGKLDLALANIGSDSVSTLLGNGNGSLQNQRTFSTGTRPRSLAIADFNNDAKPDVVVANSWSNNVGILAGNGNGSLSAQRTCATDNKPLSIAVADFNRDGKADVAVANFNAGTIGALMGNGNGSLGPQSSLPAGSNPIFVAAADINGDGHTDLLSANYGGGNVGILTADVRPRVLSIDRTIPAGPSTIDSTLTYTVTFSQSVTGVDSTDFALALSGVVASIPVGVTGGGATYSVTINGVSGNGTLGLNLVDNGSIHNAAGSPLDTGGAPYQNGQTIDISRFAAPVLADFNLDGKLDLAVGDSYGDSLSVRVSLGNGNGTFQTAQTFASGLRNWDLATSDVNGDGKPDLVTLNRGSYATGYAGSVSVLLGKGDGTFQPQLTNAVGTQPSKVVIADVNGDGRQDIVVLDSDFYSGRLAVLLGNGNGTFQTQSTFATGVQPFGLAVADINHDGRLDVITSTRPDSGTMAVLVGNGNGTFHAAATFANGRLPVDVTVADVNRDGQPDLVVAERLAGVGIFLGNGNGTFKAQTTFAAGANTMAVAVADVNGDGLIDAVAGNAYSNFVSVLLGNGDGTFVAQQSFDTRTEQFQVLIGDVNSDGHPDILSSTVGANLFLGNNNGSFRGETYTIVSRPPTSSPPAIFDSQKTYSAGPLPRGLASGDVNNDGKIDVVVTSAGSNVVGVLLGNGNGTFGNRLTFATGPTPYSVALNDVNGDGKLDLVVANNRGNNVGVLLGNGDGSFKTQTTFATGDTARSVAVSELNGDGKSDIVVANYRGNSLGVLLGNGNGTFKQQITFGAGVNPSSVVIADFNVDGKPDLATANKGSNNISVLQGYGNGTFAVQRTFATGGQPFSVAAADFNVNGSPDLVVANESGNSMGVLLGNRDGTFTPQATFQTGVVPAAVVVSDVNGDGKPDVVVGNYSSNSLGVLLGNANGTFQVQNTFATGASPFSIVASDVNRDALPDLLLANSGGNNVGVLLGQRGPVVVSINRNFPDGQVVTPLGGVEFLVTFSKPVTGVDANDFALVLNGVSVGQPLTVSGGNTVYHVSINAISGSGTLGLNLVDNGTIKDLSGNLLQPGAGIVFKSSQSYANSTSPFDVGVADFNRDGQSDLVVSQATGTDYLAGKGNGTFQPPQGVGGGSFLEFVVPADVNNDGKMDFVESSNRPSGGAFVSLGNGDGTFSQLPISLFTNSPVKSVAVGDLNGDGKPDVAVAPGYNGGVSLFFGSGDGTFTSAQELPLQGQNQDVVTIADVNGDGKTDLVTAGGAALLDGHSVGVMLGNGNGTFGSLQTFSAGPRPSMIAASDLNGDGKLDLAVANYDSSSSVSVLLGRGDGTFMPQLALTTATSPRTVRVSDLNKDGRPDLIVANPSDGTTPGTVSVFLGNGDGTFKTQQSFAAGKSPSSAVVADVNGDGRPDVAVTDIGSGSTIVLLAASNGDFVGQTFSIS